MTPQEAINDYNYDVSIDYVDFGEDGKGWIWVVNGGYSSSQSNTVFEHAADAEKELMEYLEGFTTVNQ